MKLPNAARAFIDPAKLRNYALDPMHREGKHKARVLTAALGLTATDAEWLRDRLLWAARETDCSLGRRTEYGQRYVLDLVLLRGERAARLRSVWIVRPSEDFPRLVTCYVL